VDLNSEIADVRFDIEALRLLVDRTRDTGVSEDDVMLRALTHVLHDRRMRLQDLESV
jgi:hypothetical protein